MLKNSTSDMTKWHAYSSIMTAVSPSAANAADMSAILKRLELRSSKAVKAAMERRKQIDLGKEEPWYKEEKAKLSSAFVMAHSDDVPTIENFWLSNTNVSNVSKTGYIIDSSLKFHRNFTGKKLHTQVHSHTSLRRRPRPTRTT